MTKLLQVLCFSAFFVFITSLTHAQTSSQEYRIDYDNGLLTLSAKEANLKSLLTDISEKTGIVFSFPNSLRKQITIKLFSVPLRKALRRLLKNENYAVIYSVSGKHKASAISEVYVLPEPSGSRTSRQYKSLRRWDERTRAHIRRLEKQLETLKSRIATVNEHSRQGRLIMNQIRSTEKAIERLYKRLRR